MTSGVSMIAGSDDISKGLFGYRRSDVEQLISDRDLMLRQAETRIRSAEARIAQLETALGESDDRNLRTEEQFKQLRRQLDATVASNARVEELAVLVQAEADNIASWKRRMQGTVGSLGPAVDRLRFLVDEVPTRVQQALSPLADKMTFLLALLDDFAEASRSRQVRRPMAPTASADAAR
jgi:chromosome segregation ATPase